MKWDEKQILRVVFVLALVFAAAIRLRLLDYPLERDEGEYALGGQLLLQGVAPFKSVYSLKLPGASFMYALCFLVFGQSEQGIHWGLILTTSGTALGLRMLGSRLCNDMAGTVAGAALAIFSISHHLNGLSAHATHFAAFFSVFGTVLLLKGMEVSRLLTLFLAGVFFGLALLMKQHACFFALLGGATVLSKAVASPASPFRWKGWAVYFAGSALPLALILLLCTMAGTLKSLWFWAVQYSSEYVSMVPFEFAWPNLLHQMNKFWSVASILCLLALLGFSVMWFHSVAKKQAFFIYGFLLASIASVLPGFHFRSHYFLTLLPAVCLLAGVGAAVGWDSGSGRRFRIARRGLVLGIVAAAATQLIFEHRSLFFQLGPEAASRMTYPGEPFPESKAIACFVRNLTSSGPLLVFGSEPQIYFYSRLRPSSGYIYTYGLMENQPYALQMQRRMIEEVQANPPACIVHFRSGSSWLRLPGKGDPILQWFEDYRDRNFQLEGVIVAGSPKQRILSEPGPMKDAAREHPAAIMIYRRKPNR